MPESHVAGHRLLSGRSLAGSIFKKRTSQQRPAVGKPPLFFLVSLGVIGALITTAFAIAAFSTFYSGGETQIRAGVVDRGGIDPGHSDSANNAAPVKVEPTSPGALAPLPSFAAVPYAAAPSPPSAGAAMPETSPPQPVGQISSRSAEVLQPNADAARNNAPPTPSQSSKASEPVSQEAAIQQGNQPVNPEAAVVAPGPKPAGPRVRGSHSYRYRLKANGAFRDPRIRKECGPIADPALRDQCVAYFTIH